MVFPNWSFPPFLAVRSVFSCCVDRECPNQEASLDKGLGWELKKRECRWSQRCGFLGFFLRVEFLLVTTLPSAAAPSFDGNGRSSPGSAMEVELRCEVTNLEAGKCASASVLRMGSTATDVCLAMASGELMEPNDMGRALHVLPDYFAPDASDAVYQGVEKFSHFGIDHGFHG